MITRRGLLGATAGAGILAVLPGSSAHADNTSGERPWTGSRSANGWSIDPSAVIQHRVEGSTATVALRQGVTAAVLLHVARRWHYEIAAVDGGAGGIAGFATSRTVRAGFESNYLSGTAIAVHPTAYPAGGSERLPSHQEVIVRDILLDCAGTIAWGGDLAPAKAGHFHIVARPGDVALARVAAHIGHGTHTPRRSQTAGAVTDPAVPARRTQALQLPRPR